MVYRISRIIHNDYKIYISVTKIGETKNGFYYYADI